MTRPIRTRSVRQRPAAVHLLTLLEHLAGERPLGKHDAPNCSFCTEEDGKHALDCELYHAIAKIRPLACETCGCTEFDACVTKRQPCHWARRPTVQERGRCSACKPKATS